MLNIHPRLNVSAVRKTVAANKVPVLVGALGATNVLRLASNLVLTRLLAPEAFGVVGIIFSISFILQMLSDMGFGAFVVRATETIDRRFLNVVWTVRFFRSAILTALMFTFAGLLAAAFDKPDLETPVRAASFLFLLEGMRSLHVYVAQRNQRVSYITMMEFAVYILQTAVTIVAAFILKNFWAVIIGMYTGAALKALFSYTLFPGGLHRFAWNRQTGEELWKFSRVIAASSVITLILSQADKIFIGRAMSLEEFGLYMIAFNLTGSAQQLIRTYVGRVLFPLYAQTYRTAQETLGKVFYAAKRRMALGLAFLLGGGIGGGHLIVRILLDERYIGAGIYASLLCVPPLFMLTTFTVENLMFARGNIRSTLEGNIVRLCWVGIAAPVGFYLFDIIGLISAFAFVEGAAAVFWWWRMNRFGLLDWTEEMAIYSVAAIGASVGIAADWLANYLVVAGVLPNF